MSFYLKIYPPPQQEFESFDDVSRATEKYIRQDKHTNQTSLMKFMSVTAFGHYECYEIVQFGETSVHPKTQQIISSKYAVIRVLWDGVEDERRWDEQGADEFIPKIKLQALEISHKQFKELFSLFNTVDIPIWPRNLATHKIGADGIMYDLKFGGQTDISVTYSWVNDMGGAWKQLSNSIMTAKDKINIWITEHENSQRKP